MRQLKLTTSTPGFFGSAGNPLIEIEGDIEITALEEIKAPGFYIHGEAEYLAGYDIPIILDGDLNNLNLPIEEQDILLLLPSGEYKCKSMIEQDLLRKAYYITLFDDYEFLNE